MTSRALAIVAAALTVSAAAQPRAQSVPPAAEPATRAADASDEIIVRGKRSLFRLRIETEAARERVWQVFNDINSDDDFDISCVDARRTGTHVASRACRPNYANRATSRAGKELARRIQRNCPPPVSPMGDNSQCLASAMAQSVGDTQAEMGRIAVMDERLDQEFRRLAGTNADLARAVLDFLQKKNSYEDAVRSRKR